YQIPKDEWNVEHAHFRHEIWKRRASNEGKIDGAELQALEHLDFTAQGGIGVLLDFVPTVRSRGDFLRKHHAAGTKLRFFGQDVTELERPRVLGRRRRSAERDGGYGACSQEQISTHPPVSRRTRWGNNLLIWHESSPALRWWITQIKMVQKH